MIEVNKKPNHADGLRYYNEELSIESQKLVKEKRKIKELRKQFTSDSKIKNSKKFLSEQDDKLNQWFEKINIMKQLERKRVIDLN